MKTEVSVSVLSANPLEFGNEIKKIEKSGLPVEIVEEVEDASKKRITFSDDDEIELVVEAMGGLHPAFEFVRDAILAEAKRLVAEGIADTAVTKSTQKSEKPSSLRVKQKKRGITISLKRQRYRWPRRTISTQGSTPNMKITEKIGFR
mgnify:CR=1 FL=1